MKAINKFVMRINHRCFFVALCCIVLMSCDKREKRIQEEVEKIAAERSQLAEVQQEAREKVAADLSARADTRDAVRAATLERAAAEQARREGITAELKEFVDSIYPERAQINKLSLLRMNGYPVKPGSFLVSPAGSSIRYTKEDGDFFWFEYDEEAFSITLRKTGAGFSTADVKYKQPLVEGWEVAQRIPETTLGSTSSTSSRALLILKATYGTGQTQRDVKDLVKSKIQNGRLNFHAGSWELGGDPVFGQSKTFYVKYVTGGRVAERSFREGENVSLP